MAVRRQTLLNQITGTELLLPVTPKEYSWETGINVETLNIDSLGDLNVPGYRKLNNFSVDCMFPAQAYPFNEAGAVTDPKHYIGILNTWCTCRSALRYIVSGTYINKPVIIESYKFYEQDGTNDVYCKITLREYISLNSLMDVGSASVSTSDRSDDSAATSAGTYAVKKGDTLWAICRKYYGDPNMYSKLAKANSIKNPNIISVGQVLTIPAKADLN